MKKINTIFVIFLIALIILGSVIYGYLFNYHSDSSKLVLNQDNVSLFIEPEDGPEPVLEAIGKAAKSIDLEVYLLSDDEIIKRLIEAQKRGVNVRVILEESPYSGFSANKEVKEKLSYYGIDVKWNNRVYVYTHSKFIVIDGKTVIIMTLNLTKSSFTKNREFGLLVSDSETAKEVERIFEADWNRKPYRDSESAIIVSPENARRKMEQLFRSATSEILIYAEDMDDPSLKQILKSKSSEGVLVYCIVADPYTIDENKYVIDELSAYGIKIKYLVDPFVHAKIAVIDRSVCYIGSINFTSNSLDNNREVGIFISNNSAVSRVISQFFKDYNKALN